MIIITGSSGFIGGALAKKLINNNFSKIILCDFVSAEDDSKSIFVETDQIFSFIDKNNTSIDWIFHLGAITDTTCLNELLLNTYNFNFSVKIWEYCVKYSIPLMYASSAATYGDGNLGFIDDHNIVHKLIPLNLYAKSKNDFDQFVLTQSITPPHWFGFKFFNVFGFDESRKGKMSSIIYQAFNKINMDNKMQLFKSYNDSFLHGFQERDFVYINDVINVLLFFMGIPYSGIYNLGSGKSTTYISLIESVFKSMSIESNIEFVEMPLALREKYQYSTKADLKKLRSVGYNRPFMNITESIDDYVCKYLTEK